VSYKLKDYRVRATIFTFYSVSFSALSHCPSLSIPPATRHEADALTLPAL